MIEVTVKVNDHEIAYIRIQNVETHPDDTADYSVHFAVDRALGAVGVHQRSVADFPRLRYNALALLRQALDTLEPRELELENGTRAGDLGIPSWSSRWGRLRRLPRGS